MAETTPANIADELSDEFNSSIWTFYQTNLSARTRKEYLNIIRNFTKLTKTDPLKLTKEAAECYINELNARYTQKKLSYNTLVMRISAIGSSGSFRAAGINSAPGTPWSGWKSASARTRRSLRPCARSRSSARQSWKPFWTVHKAAGRFRSGNGPCFFYRFCSSSYAPSSICAASARVRDAAQSLPAGYTPQDVRLDTAAHAQSGI